jgi:hypothetical protein
LDSAAADSVILTTSTLNSDAGYYLRVQQVEDLFGNAITHAIAPVLPARLALYLKGDSGVTVDATGSLVVDWADQTTNRNNAVQYFNGPTSRPASHGTVNGVPALTFNSGNTNYLEVASRPSVAITGNMSVYVVGTLADLNAPRQFLGKTRMNIPAPYDYYVRPDRSQISLFRGNGTANGAAHGLMPSGGAPHVFSAVMEGANVNHYLDGLSNGSGVISTTIGDSGTPLMIGTRHALDQFMNGEMAEVLIFGSALSKAERLAVDNYLGFKYFPFSILQQPNHVVTTEGLTATFSVSASQGSAHFEYQWQAGGMNIDGATNASYTTPPLSLADNGQQLRVLITIPGVSTNFSSLASLTVSADNEPPAVTAVGRPIWSENSIIVTFSEDVNPFTAASAANYTLDNGASVLAATMGDAPNKVVLTTTPLVPGLAYSVTVRNVQDNFNNTISTVSIPSGVYPPAMALWLKADAGVIPDGSGYVSQWNDQSGNDNNFVAGIPPLLVNNEINGLPVLRFDGLSTYMYAASSPSLAITDDMAIIAVVNFSSLTSGGTRGMIVSKTSLNQPAPYDYYVRSSAVQFYRGNGSVNGLSAGASVPSIGVPHVLNVVMQGTTVTHRLDGRPNGGGVLSTTIADAGNPVFIGSRQDNVNHLDGDLAELIILNGSLSSNDLVSIENYLGAKYNLVIGDMPSLSIAKAGANLLLSWPTPTASFALESAPDLSGAGWSLVTNEISSANGVSSVTLSPTGAEQFFRLRKE